MSEVEPDVNPEVENEENKQYDKPQQEETQNNVKAIIIVRGYVIYAKNDNEDLYDFFYPALQNRMTLTEARKTLPENHKLLTIERETRHIEIPMSVIEQYGKIIH